MEIEPSVFNKENKTRGLVIIWYDDILSIYSDEDDDASLAKINDDGNFIR